VRRSTAGPQAVNRIRTSTLRAETGIAVHLAPLSFEQTCLSSRRIRKERDASWLRFRTPQMLHLFATFRFFAASQALGTAARRRVSSQGNAIQRSIVRGQITRSTVSSLRCVPSRYNRVRGNVSKLAENQRLEQTGTLRCAMFFFLYENVISDVDLR
jgi:hypothetical protein